MRANLNSEVRPERQPTHLSTFTAGITGMPQMQGEQSYMNPGLLNYAQVLGML